MKHTVFNSEGDKFRNKEIKNYVVVKVVIDMVCGNTKKLDYTKHPMAKQISKISVMDYYPNTHKNNMHVEIIDGDVHKSANLSDSEKSCVNLNQNADMAHEESQQGTVLTDSETARQNALPDCECVQKSNEEKAVSTKPTEKKRLYSSAKPPDDF